MASATRRLHDPSATASVHIDAAPDVVYALVTDLPTLAAMAAETVAMRWREGSPARPGAVFTGDNENGAQRWTTKCTVTDADPGRVFAFDVRYAVLPIAHWRYDIVAVDGGCRVSESTWDRRPGWFRALAGRATGVPDRAAANAEHIRATLQNLKERAEAA